MYGSASNAHVGSRSVGGRLDAKLVGGFRFIETGATAAAGPGGFAGDGVVGIELKRGAAHRDDVRRGGGGK